MPSPEPSEIPRPLFARRPELAPAPAPSEPPPERTESFHPQYVRLHTLREHGHGPRNLAWGVVTILLALVLVSISLFVVGPRVLLSLAVCLLTFTALFVLARMHIFRQRNGGFLALGIVCLFGAAMPLVELAYSALDAFVKSRPIATLAPVATSAISSASDPSPLSLIDAFALPAPDAKAGPRVRVTKDFRVTIDGKTYLAKSGDIFPLASRSGRDVKIAVRDLLVAVPAEAIEVTDDKPASNVKTLAGTEPAAKPARATDEPPASETPAEATARAQREVIRRYPALGVKGSLENQSFINLYTEMRDNGGDDFFKNPDWPIDLAEILAKRDHWQRGAPPATTGPADAPAEESSAPAVR